MRIMLYIILLSLSGCLQSQDESEIMVTIELKMLRSDELQIFYSNKYLEPYLEQNSKTLAIKGSNTYQKYSFAIPYQTNRIRIDLGNDSLQAPIEIKSIQLQLDGEKTLFSPLEIGSYFEFNKFARYDQSGVITTFSLDGQYDPYFISKNLRPLLRKLNKS